MARAGEWLKTSIDNKPWWAIVAVAILSTIGSQLVTNVPALYAWGRSFFPVTSTVVVVITHKDTAKPVVGADVSILDTTTLQSIAPAKPGSADKTNMLGIANVNLTAMPGLNFALFVKFDDASGSYKFTSPIVIRGDTQFPIVFDPKTWKEEPSTATAAGLPIAPSRLPVWMPIAYGEMGQKEVPGPESNPRIVEYIRSTGAAAGMLNDETPWNSAFVNWVLQQSKIAGTRSLAANSWMNWGRPTTPPMPGCIVLFWRQSPNEAGHVGFYVGETQDTISVLGGNQDNQVRISSFPKSRLLGCRLPL